MKRALGFFLAMLSGMMAFGQGTVLFQNLGGGIDAPVFEYAPEGTVRVSGTNFLAQLYAGANASTIAPIGDPVPFDTNGHFFGGVVTIPTVPPGGTAMALFKVWRVSDGATFEQAASVPGGESGSSLQFAVQLGVGNSAPASLTNLVSAEIGPWQAGTGTGPELFSNQGNGLDAPILDVDGTTRLAGTNYLASVDVGGEPGKWLFTSPPLPFGTNGYFSGLVHMVKWAFLPTFGRVRVWRFSDGPTFEEAMRSAGAHLGVSGTFTITIPWLGYTNAVPPPLHSFTLSVSAPDDYIVVFSNRGNGIDAPIFDVDGITPLTGTNYVAQLYAGYDTNTLAPVGDLVPFVTNGYFRSANVFAGAALSDGTVVVEVRAWRVTHGSTFEIAQSTPGARWGISPPFTIVRGNGNGPVPLTGLQSFSLTNTPPLQFGAANRSADGTIQLAVYGAPGRTYVAESSGDLTNWTGFLTNTVRLNGNSQVGIDARKMSPRFYRARTP